MIFVGYVKHIAVPRFLVALAILGCPLVAHAQNAIAFRLGPGAQMTCMTGVPTHVSTRGTIWCSSADANKLHYTDPSGADIALGAGGGSGYATVKDEGTSLTQRATVNFIGAGVTCVDNSGATRTDCTIPGGGSTTLALGYAAGSAAADSIFSLDSTRAGIIIRDNATPIGNLLDIQASTTVSKFLFDASNLTFGANRGVLTVAGNGAFDFSNATGIFKTSTGTNTLSGNVSLASGKTLVYAGGASTFDASLSSGIFKTTTGAHTFGSAAWGVPANLVVTGAASSTNTTGMSHVANVATGASSIAHRLDNTTDLTTGTLLSIQSANTQRLGFQWDGTVAVLTGGSAITSFLANDGTGFQGNSGVAYVRNAGVATYQFTSTDLTPMGAQKLGTSATPWPATFSKHYAGGGTAPTKAAGTCIGGTQTVSLDANATDTTGTLTFTGTGTGTAAGICATVTFNGTWPTAPHCYVTPANAASNALSGNSAMFVDAASTTTGVFVVKVGSTALLAGTYLLNYVCIQ